LVKATIDWPDRRLVDLFGTTTPIIQAPMAGANGAELAIAAIRGGALGSLPCALLSADRVIEDSAAVRAAVKGPINLNFFCHRLIDDIDDSAWRSTLAPFYAEYGAGPPTTPPPVRAPFDEAMCEVIEQVRPAVVSFHFGLPSDALLARVRRAGSIILSSATTIAEARWLDERGVDAIIAQGWEAGGHAGRFLPADPAAQMGLIALVPQIVDAVSVPVIAAGGIADGRGIAAALTLGASAVQIGTAYLRTPESLIPRAHRAMLGSEAAEETRFTNLLTGGLARGLTNRLVAELGPINPAAPPFPYASAAASELRKAAEARGLVDFTPVWSGQAALLADELPAQTLTERLTADALARLASGSKIR